jgi:hypothetical protein
MRGCVQAKSEVRVAVEALLAKATPENPLTAAQIIQATGHKDEIVRAHISNAVSRGFAHNLNAGKQKGGLYVAGPAPKTWVANMPAPRTAPPSGEYKPPKWFIAREEATAHEDCPSIWNGEVTRYTRPFSNAGRALEPVGHGGLKFA